MGIWVLIPYRVAKLKWWYRLATMLPCQRIGTQKIQALTGMSISEKGSKMFEEKLNDKVKLSLYEIFG